MRNPSGKDRSCRKQLIDQHERVSKAEERQGERERLRLGRSHLPAVVQLGVPDRLDDAIRGNNVTLDDSGGKAFDDDAQAIGRRRFRVPERAIDEAAAPFHAQALRFVIGADDDRWGGQADLCLRGRPTRRPQRSRYRLSAETRAVRFMGYGRLLTTSCKAARSPFGLSEVREPEKPFPGA